MKRIIGTLVVAVVLVGLNGSQVTHAQGKQGKPKGIEAAGTVKTATFEVYKDKDGEYRFRLKDSAGDVMATSGKGYKTKDDCTKVINSIKTAAGEATVVDSGK